MVYVLCTVAANAGFTFESKGLTKTFSILPDFAHNTSSMLISLPERRNVLIISLNLLIVYRVI